MKLTSLKWNLLSFHFIVGKILCTIVENRQKCVKHLEELRYHLLKCGYPLHLINAAITKYLSIDQKTLREKKSKVKGENLVFLTTHNPRNPNVNKIINNAMEVLNGEPTLNKIFGHLKVIKSKRVSKSLGDILTSSSYSTREFSNGVKKCNVSRCKTCNHITPCNSIYLPKIKMKHHIKGEFDCTIKDCIYLLTCGGCLEYYIGKTVNLRHRMTTHRSCIHHDDLRVMQVSKHLAECGNGQFSVVPLYKMKRKGIVAILATENYFIRKYKPTLNTRT